MNIFLDFDGTLVDIKPRHYEVYTMCLVAFNGTPVSIDDYWDLKRRDAKWSDILALSGVDAVHENPYLAEFIQKIEKPEILKIDRMFPGSLDTLKELSKEHTVSLVSLRRSHDNLINQLEDLGITGYFTNILSGHSDTKKGVLTKKAEVIKTVDGHEGGIMVGDTEADVSAAKNLGIPVIAVTSGIRDERFLSELKPDYLVESVQECVRLLR